MHHRNLPCLAAVVGLAVPLAAQWSASPAANLAIADGSATQDQPKLAPTADGGCYVSWYDSDPNGSPPFGYDVRLQRLDQAGHELWGHGGVLVADRGFSSTQDYGLDVDAAGDALLAFRDDRFGGTQITAARVDPSGILVWGTAGVQLTNTTNFVAAPKIAGTTDGGIVVAWTENNTTQVMKLDATGAPLWASNVVLAPPSGNYGVSDMHGADNGSVIVALQLSGGFTSPRHLEAQKLDASGAPLWGATPVAVFDGGSLQFGNFPTFVTDGAGGAVFAWYSSSPSLECFAQRVDANGNELFPHNGVAVSTSTGMVRVSPSVAFDGASQSTLVCYRQQDALQSQSGVSAQKFDATGARLWGSTGTSIVPVSPDLADNTVCVASGGGMLAFWTGGPSSLSVVVRGARVDAAGAAVVAPFDVSSTPTTKFRLQAARSSLGFAITAWHDEASGNPDILAQNALPDGTLGGLASATSRNGTGVNPVCYTTTELPEIGTTWHAQLAHSANGMATGTIWSLAPATGPSFFFGESLVAPPIVFVTSQTSSGTSDTLSVAIPAQIGLVGAAIATQGVRLDNGVVELCNAIDLTIGL